VRYAPYMDIPSWPLDVLLERPQFVIISCRLSICACYYGLESCSNVICNCLTLQYYSIVKCPCENFILDWEHLEWVISVPPAGFHFIYCLCIATSESACQSAVMLFLESRASCGAIATIRPPRVPYDMIERMLMKKRSLIRVCRLSNGDVYCSGYAV
jgi:hypothetical protein